MKYLSKLHIGLLPMMITGTGVLEPEKESIWSPLSTSSYDIDKNPEDKFGSLNDNGSSNFKYVTRYVWQYIISLTSKRLYEQELENKSYLELNASVYNDAFNFIINNLSIFQPVNLHIKITHSNSLYFKFGFQNNLVVRMEIFLDESDVFDENEENTSLIIEKDFRNEIGAYNSISDAIAKLHEILTPSNYVDFFANESSNSVFEENEFQNTA